MNRKNETAAPDKSEQREEYKGRRTLSKSKDLGGCIFSVDLKIENAE